MHYGLTSSDVVDTALALQMTRALDRILPAAAQLESAIAARAREFRDTPMVGRTHGIHAEPTTFGMKLALWAMQVRRDRERLARARRRSPSASCRARSARSPTSTRRSSATCASGSGSRRSPRRRCCRATATPRCSTRARRSGRASSRSRSRSATCSAPRCARRRRRSARGPEGFQRDAAQAQPGQVGAALRPRPRAARQPAGRARRRRAVARARHLALVGRAHHRSRLADARLLRDRAVDEGHLGVARVPRAHAAQPRRVVRPRVQPAGAARARRGRASRDDAYRIVQRNAMRAWQEERSFRELLVADPEVAPRSTPRASTRASTSSARSPTSATRSTRSIGWRRRRCRTTMAIDDVLHGLPHVYSGKVRELYEVSHDRLLMVASDRVSVFDVVLPDEIPDKGRVLTGVSQYWFDQTADIVPNHVISSDPTDFPETAGDVGGGPCSCARRGRSGWNASCADTSSGTAGRSTPSRAPSAGSRCRRAAAGRAAAGAAVHADDEGRVGSRPAVDRGRGRRAGRRRHVRAAPRPLDPDLRARCRARRARPRARRHEVRVRRARRRDHRHRRDDDARLVALLAARGVQGRHVAAVVRQAVRARLHGQHRVESRSAGAQDAGRGDRLGAALYREAYELLTGASLDDWHAPDE